MAADSDHAPIVEAVGLSKVFKDFWGRPKAMAVNGVDFTVGRGQVLGLLGPNGSGKSTTVKMIMGLLRPSAGSLKVFGEPPDTVSIKGQLGYLPEETHLYKYLTAAETLDFFGALFNLHPRERKRRIGQLLEWVGLAHSADRPVGEFSKGMARRIGLAQALINSPSLVVLDEPTSGLDPIGIQDVKKLIRYLADKNTSFILSSHIMADVEDICDSVLIMYGGKVRASGRIDELLTLNDQTRITAPTTLSRDVIERVMRILNEHGDGADVVVDHPTRTLDDYFMDVIDMARKESDRTAGAAAGGTIADYLSEPKTGEAFLVELAATPKAPADDDSEEVVDKASEPDLERLSALTEDSDDGSGDGDDATAEPPADEEKTASSRIEDAMNKSD